MLCSKVAATATKQVSVAASIADKLKSSDNWNYLIPSDIINAMCCQINKSLYQHFFSSFQTVWYGFQNLRKKRTDIKPLITLLYTVDRF